MAAPACRGRPFTLTVASFWTSSSEAPREARPISWENWANFGSASRGTCPSSSWHVSLKQKRQLLHKRDTWGPVAVATKPAQIRVVKTNIMSAVSHVIQTLHRWPECRLFSQCLRVKCCWKSVWSELTVQACRAGRCCGECTGCSWRPCRPDQPGSLWETGSLRPASLWTLTSLKHSSAALVSAAAHYLPSSVCLTDCLTAASNIPQFLGTAAISFHGSAKRSIGSLLI